MRRNGTLIIPRAVEPGLIHGAVAVLALLPMPVDIGPRSRSPDKRGDRHAVHNGGGYGGSGAIRIRGFGKPYGL